VHARAAFATVDARRCRRFAARMSPRRPDAVPVDALRDLIGLVRAIRAAKAKAPAAMLAQIDKVGAELVAAYDLAVSSTPGTLGMRAASVQAEEATRAVSDLVTMTDGAEEIVTAARARVTRARDP
jgi:hypothetical protein